MDFIAKFKWLVGVLVDYDACYRIAYENVEDAFNEGIDYSELRFSPSFMAEPHDLDPEGVVDAVIAGIQNGEKEFGIKVNLIEIISCTYGVDNGWGELNALLSQRDQMVGLDLAGNQGFGRISNWSRSPGDR
jgi:adenosine deaminase